VALDLPYYPIYDYGPLMKGLIIGGLGIFHVFTAQFAIGGGLLMCYFQWLAQTGRNPHARIFLDSYFRALVLISFVLGAVTGVAMWFTSIQISPRTIGIMIDEFHWIWASEWTFFVLEIFAGYAFYRYAKSLNDRARMTLLVLYSFGAWMSLFLINGILAYQLTPGRWLDSGSVAAGFFNPSFWPSLFYRTLASMAIAALVACIVINTFHNLDRQAKRSLINRTAHFMVPMLLMPIFGIWFLAVIPADSRSYVMGGSAVMTLFLNLAVGATVLIGGYALIALFLQKLYINGATATLLAALAFGATAGGEFVREGVRKPFTIREALYSNSIRAEQICHLREVGSVTHDPYPLLDAANYPNDQLRLGAKVFRFQCSVCHTMDGVNGLGHLTGTWSLEQKRMNIAKLQLTKSFMPPFAGTPEELEALVQFLTWHNADRPATWPVSDDPAALQRIGTWLDEAGVEPGYRQKQAGLTTAGAE
jgi:hypothetical protein